MTNVRSYIVLTTTHSESVKPPSTVLTVISAQPAAPWIVTRPLALTVATSAASLSQVTRLFVALVGVTVAVTWMVFPLSVVSTGRISRFSVCSSPFSSTE